MDSRAVSRVEVTLSLSRADIHSRVALHMRSPHSSPLRRHQSLHRRMIPTICRSNYNKGMNRICPKFRADFFVDKVLISCNRYQNVTYLHFGAILFLALLHAIFVHKFKVNEI
jgi:hypothetical protein